MAIKPIDLVIASLTDEPVRENSDDGSRDIWLQAELHFLGSSYVIVAEPVGWDSEQCLLFRIDDDEAIELDLPTGSDLTVDSLPALCTLAYNDASIRMLREPECVAYCADSPMRVQL